jgi:YVTN family beta-propeller protein
MQSTKPRFSLAVTCLVCLLGFTVLARPAEAQPFAYIANSGSNTVSVVDAASNTQVATIAVGNRPIVVAISPDGTRVYVTNSNSNTVSVLATVDNSVIATIAVGSNPNGVAVSPDGSRVFVMNTDSNSVSVIAVATNTVIGTIEGLGTSPAGVAITPDGSRAYVTNAGSSSVSVIDTGSNSVVDTIGVGVNALGIAITPDGTRAYVANNVSGSVSVIDIDTNTVVATIAMFQPVAVGLTPDGSRLYVTNSSETFGSVSVVDTASNTVNATIVIGPNAQGIALAPDGRRAYAASFGSDSVWVIDTATNTAIAPVAVESAPVGVALTPRIGPLRIETPNRSSRWGIGTRQRLAWRYEGNATAFEIDVSRDGGTTWTWIATEPNKPGTSQSFYWVVTGPAASAVRLRVQAIESPEATDVNDADIRVAEPFVRVILPYSRTVVGVGTAAVLFFEHNLGANRSVAIDVSADDGESWRTIADHVLTRGSTTSSYHWVVDVPPTAHARVRIRALDGTGAVGDSEAFAVIDGPGELSVTHWP